MELEKRNKMLNLIFSFCVLVLTVLMVAGLFGALTKTTTSFGSEETYLKELVDGLTDIFKRITDDPSKIIETIQSSIQTFFAVIFYVVLVIQVVIRAIFILIASLKSFSKAGDFRDLLKPFIKLVFSFLIYVGGIFWIFYYKDGDMKTSLGWGTMLILICALVGVGMVCLSQIFYFKKPIVVVLFKTVAAFIAACTVAFMYVGTIHEGDSSYTTFRILPEILNLFKGADSFDALKDRIFAILMCFAMFTVSAVGAKLLRGIVLNGFGLKGKKAEKQGYDYNGNSAMIATAIIGGALAGVGLVMSGIFYTQAFQGGSKELGFAPFLFAGLCVLNIVIAIIVRVIDKEQATYAARQQKDRDVEEKEE